MPIIRVEWFEGRTQDQKRELARVFTEALASIGGVNPDSVDVIFEERRKENWAKGGVLYTDIAPQVAS